MQTSQQAIDYVRASRDIPAEVPDETIDGMMVTAQVNLALRMEDLGRAFRDSLPRPLRRLIL